MRSATIATSAGDVLLTVSGSTASYTVARGEVPPPPISAVSSDGWQATDTTPSDLSLANVVVEREGFDATGAATTYVELLRLTKRVRQVYPNEGSFTTDQVALSDYVYSGDTIDGVTNSSTEDSPKPIAAWVMTERERVTGSTVHWEIAAFHRNARQGRQVACVKVRANDGTTQTDWQTVAAPTLSTFCEDANAPEVFEGDLTISSLADGGFWLEAEVYPWFGDSTSVLKSEDNYSGSADQREFTRRWFRKDNSAIQYVAVASTGNDSTGVVSTTEATAIATPCLTWAGALKKAHDTLGATDGALDVLHIVIVDGVDGGAVTFTGSYKQDISAVVTTRATGTTRAAAVLTTTSNLFPDFDSHTIALDEGALIFEDMTFTLGGAHSLNGATGVPLHVMFKDCTIDAGSFGTTMRASGLTALSFFGCTFSNMPASSLNPLAYTTAGDIRLLRGCTVDMNQQTMEGWVFVGNDITGSKGQSYSDPTKGVIFYNNKFLSPNGTISAIVFESFGTTTQTLGGCAIVQNLVEWTSTSSNPAIRIAADGDEGSIVHAVVHHNVCPGTTTYGRWNVFYDDDATVQTSHKLISFKGNLGAQLNTKGDVFLSDGTRIGNFPFHHGVGCEGVYTIDQDAGGGGLSFGQAYGGVGSLIDNGDPLFTDNQATTAGPVAGAGGGDYTLAAGSAARDILSGPVLAFDLAGASRGAGTQDAGAYA